MNVNVLPHYNAGDNTTGCCPRFKPEGWDSQTLHWQVQLFVRATTRSIAHVPLNMGRVFERTFKAIEEADAVNEDCPIVLSRDESAQIA